MKRQKKIKMKSVNLFYLLFIGMQLFSCKGEPTQKESHPNADAFPREAKQATMYIDIIGNSQFICFTPVGCTLEYIVNTPPQRTDSTILFCAAASFTGRRMETFDYSNICGTYIAESMVRNPNFQTTRNIDASFAYWDDSSYFSVGKDLNLLDKTVSNGGVFFMQKQVLCNGERGEMNLVRSIIYRVLARYNERLCVIQNTAPMSYTAFVEGLEKLGITDAIYLDMGGWSYSWYRDEEGKVVELFPISNDTKYQTNWIIFKKKN